MSELKKEENNHTAISATSQFPFIDKTYLSSLSPNQVVGKALDLFYSLLGKENAFTNEKKEELHEKMRSFLSDKLPKLEDSLVADLSRRDDNDKVLERMFEYFKDFSQVDPKKANYRANFYGMILYLISYNYLVKQEDDDKDRILKFREVLNKAKVEVKPDAIEEYIKLLRYAVIINYLTSLFTPFKQMFDFAAGLLQGPGVDYYRQSGNPGKPKINRDKIYKFITGILPRFRKKKPKENIDENSTQNEDEQLASHGTEQMSIEVLITSQGGIDPRQEETFQVDPKLLLFGDNLEGIIDLDGLLDFENCKTIQDLDQRANQIWEVITLLNSASRKRTNENPSQVTSAKRQKKHPIKG